MNKLTALVAAAKAYKSGYEVTDYRNLTDPQTILELCALLEKAEEALKMVNPGQLITWRADDVHEQTLAAIKQWKEKT